MFDFLGGIEMTIKVFTVAEMVAAERAADGAGVSYDEMMETAGRRVAEAIIERLPVKNRRVLILVGPGNNGGDGLVAGRYLAEAGADVAFYLYKSREVEQDVNYALVQKMGLFVVEAGLDQRYRDLRTRLQNTDIILDALLGTGVTRAIGGNLAGLFKEVKSFLDAQNLVPDKEEPLTSIAQVGQKTGWQKKPLIVAVDCPSGLNCDSGALDPLAIKADLTVTFAGPKRGHFRFPGAAACGELVVADINISPDLPDVKGVAVKLATTKLTKALMPRRSVSGHKGTFGTALIAAGSEHYWGAPLLAAQGAYRAGGGLVALAVPGVIRATVAGQMPEATYPPVSSTKVLGADSARFLLEQSGSVKGMLIGPGMGSAVDFVRTFLEGHAGAPDLHEPQLGLPSLVFDADGLNVLAKLPEWWQMMPARTILTPHPGEMARLMGVSLSEIKTADRVDLACDRASTWGHIVLLKGAYTVVAAPDGHCTILPFANPLLAVGGSGDVLSGIIVGLLAQGLKPYDAAVLGGYLHGAAGELAAEKFGDAGLLAGELADWIPMARQRILEI
jgi:NAD(P)H-hydrate epimerase